MRMLKRDIEDVKVVETNDQIAKKMAKDNVLGFIKESRQSMIIMNKALGTQMTSKKSDPKKQAVIQGTYELRSYLQTYG